MDDNGAPKRIDVLVVCQKEFEAELLAGRGLPFAVETCHFGNFVGIDRWRGVACIIIVGRTQPSPNDVEIRAEILFKREIAPVGTEDGWYPKVPAAIRISGAAVGPTLYVDQHPDPGAEAVRWQICEGALVQAVGRGRGVNRTEQDPLQIDVIADVVLPIEVDEVVDWKAAQPGQFVVMAAQGWRFGDGRDVSGMAVRLLPDGWKNEHAFRQSNHDLNVRNAYNKLSISESDVENQFVAFVVKRALARYAQEVEIDLGTHSSPRAAIEAQIGEPMEKFRLKADITVGCPRDFLVMQFAKDPTRIVRRGANGKLIEYWRDYAGNLIAPPRHAPPEPLPPAPTRGNLFLARNPQIVRSTFTHSAGRIDAEWCERRTGREIEPPRGDLNAVGPDVLAEHQAAVMAMDDDEIMASLIYPGGEWTPTEIAAIADGVRVIAVGSPEKAAELFMGGRRIGWQRAVATHRRRIDAMTDDEVIAADAANGDRATIAARLRRHARRSPMTAARVFLPGWRERRPRAAE
jgi:hypothetical protein